MSSAAAAPVPQVRVEAPYPPIISQILTIFGYGILMFFGHLRDWFGAIFKPHARPPVGYAPLVSDFEDFYTRRLYDRIHDCWNRPISSCPASEIDVIDRKLVKYGQPLVVTGQTKRCINLGSYNYLGFGDPNSPTKPAVIQALEQYSVSTTSYRDQLGTTTLHRDLEKLVARFIGKEDAMVFGMGFGTNSTGIPSLVGKGGLIVSDERNHSSMVTGARTSGAAIRVFKHNDPADLEAVLRSAICEGQPVTRRPWTKILILVEGIYSMEGELCPLKEIVAVKNKYKCFLYVDEAHSIGAIGETGHGICEAAGVNPADVDVLMGTFTKAFGAIGGYISGTKELIHYLRNVCPGSVYSSSISPPAVQQCISAMKIILGEDGTDIGKKKLTALRENSIYFRRRLLAMGCHVLGDFGSPVAPIMLYNPGKIAAFSRECYERNLAVVVVGFPASQLLLSRCRFCISAGHTKAQLEDALEKIEEVVDLLGIRYAGKPDNAHTGAHLALE